MPEGKPPLKSDLADIARKAIYRPREKSLRDTERYLVPEESKEKIWLGN